MDIIVRPPRSEYDLSELLQYDSVCLPYGRGFAKRTSLDIVNSRGQKIMGSLYSPPAPLPNNPGVIYLHGNASCQLEGTQHIQSLCSLGIALICIDTSGCGLSDGAYIGLGVLERDDVAATAALVRSQHGIGPLMLWGRSMGATIAVWCACEKKIALQGIIADSAYQSLAAIVEDMTANSWGLKILAKILYPFVDRVVKKAVGFPISDIAIPFLKEAEIPVLFVHAAWDDFIAVRESRELFARYGGREKYFVTCEGKHNTMRPADIARIELEFVSRVFETKGDVGVLDEEGGDRSAAHFGDIAEMAAAKLRK
jgi:pimeloyl-ACP methyl ester carboxylesterase